MESASTCYICNTRVLPTAKHCPSCGERLVLQDRYRMLRRLGKGGFGAVFEAYDTRLRRRCAIKIIREVLPNQQQQIQLEVDILSQYASQMPFIPHIYDSWNEPSRTYLVMEYIDGATVNAAQPLPWPPAQVEEFTRTLLQLLSQLHAVGIIHRDLKPQNIIRRPDGRYVLIDFGISKQGASTQLAARGMSINYAPPEQMKGARTDARSDLYSLAATAYYLLSGNSPTDAVSRLSGAAFPAPSQFVAGIRPAFEAVLWQMLDMEPARRPPSAQAALDLLGPPPTPVPAPWQTPSPPPPPAPARKIPPWALIAGALLLVVMLGAGGLGLSRLLSPTTPGATTSQSITPPEATRATATPAPPSPTPDPSPRTGDSAPSFTLEDAGGKRVTLASELRRYRSVVLVFYYSYG